MDKIKLRRELLEGMCICAEYIDEVYYLGGMITGVDFYNSECPEPFKPGVADKYMFNRIIEANIDIIIKELEIKNITNPKMIGAQLMIKHYYPQYGKWRVMPKLSWKQIWG